MRTPKGHRRFPQESGAGLCGPAPRSPTWKALLPEASAPQEIVLLGYGKALVKQSSAAIVGVVVHERLAPSGVHLNVVADEQAAEQRIGLRFVGQGGQTLSVAHRRRSRVQLNELHVLAVVEDGVEPVGVVGDRHPLAGAVRGRWSGGSGRRPPRLPWGAPGLSQVVGPG